MLDLSQELSFQLSQESTLASYDRFLREPGLWKCYKKSRGGLAFYDLEVT